MGESLRYDIILDNRVGSSLTLCIVYTLLLIRAIASLLEELQHCVTHKHNTQNTTM